MWNSFFYTHYMLKGILEYSIVALLYVPVGYALDSLIKFPGSHISMFIIPLIITAIGAIFFYKKRMADNYRLLKSIIFFVASSILSQGVFWGVLYGFLVFNDF